MNILDFLHEGCHLRITLPISFIPTHPTIASAREARERLGLRVNSNPYIRSRIRFV